MRITGIPKSQFLLVSALVVLAAVTASAAAWPSASNEAKPAVAEEKAKAAAPSGADGEIHRKAQRFARLLMDDIKLYNQAKVNEGRQNKDLYGRLKEDIEKSRASYDKRYGSTVASQSDYFTEEVIKVLADNDIALMGGGFPK